jgi:hypothetical protein
MTRDDIIRMARDAGDVTTDSRGRESFEFDDHGLKRFAALIAAAERDRMCEQFGIPKELAHEKAKGNETDRTAILGKS